jgi:hypothetical protein
MSVFRRKNRSATEERSALIAHLEAALARAYAETMRLSNDVQASTPRTQRVSWDDAVAYIEHPSHTLGRQASPHSPPPQAP